MIRRSAHLLAIAAIVTALAAFESGGPRTSASGGPGILAAGYDHTCVLLETGGVQCVGANVSGQLGDGTTTSSASPVAVCEASDCAEHLSAARSISSGREHTCVLTTAGGVRCWGANGLFQLGNGKNVSSSTPVDVSGFSAGVAQVSAGRYYTCAVTKAGAATCWGSNFYGQLGDGTNADRGAPTTVQGLATGAASVETERYHACAVMSVRTLKCWGDNADGQLGHPGVSAANAPVDVCADAGCEAPLTDVAKVSLGLHSTCELTTVGGVMCWGANESGQLGNSMTGGSNVPVAVAGLSGGVTELAVGDSTVCVLTTGGTVKCWGDNRYGQLGNNSTVNSSAPVDVCADETCSAPLSGVAGISSGAHHACVIMQTGGVKCWGLNNAGQLGDGTTTGRRAPVDTLLSGVKPVPTATATSPATNTPNPTRSPAPTATPQQQRGDANCDGRVDSIDAALILQYSAGLLSGLACSTGADANRDSRINALDAALVLQHVAGLLPDL